MPIYASIGTAKEINAIYAGDENGKAVKIAKIYAGNSNNKAVLVYDDTERDFTNLNFKCTFVNDATGGNVTVGSVYTSIPQMYNTGAELNSSATFISDKLKLRNKDIVKVKYALTVPSGCNEYGISFWIIKSDGTTVTSKSAYNSLTGEFTLSMSSTVNPVGIIINIYGSKARATLTSCEIYVNDIKIL